MRKDFALLYVDIIETLANANINYDSFAISTVVLFVKNEMVWRFFILCQLLNYFILAQSLLHFHRHGPDSWPFKNDIDIAFLTKLIRKMMRIWIKINFLLILNNKVVLPSVHFKIPFRNKLYFPKLYWILELSSCAHLHSPSNIQSERTGGNSWFCLCVCSKLSAKAFKPEYTEGQRPPEAFKPP